MRYSGRFLQFALPLLFIGLQNPAVASAGALSLISSLFSKAEAQDTTTLPAYQGNSQTTQLLSAAKHRDPNPSRGGGDVEVVDGTALVAEGGPIEHGAEGQSAPKSGISTYIVQEGDTLSQIAEMFGVTVNTIAWANDLSPKASLQAGKTLVILPITGVQHTVKSGDTLESIAQTYQGDAIEILRYNDLADASALTEGLAITIPDGIEPKPPEPKPEPKKASSKVSSSAKRPLSVSSRAAVSISDSGAGSGGYYANPLPGGTKTQGVHGYNGVDIAAPAGTPIVAAASGVVDVSLEGGYHGGYGNYVVLSHPNGTQTLYAHMLETAVSQGASVVKGQVIGYVGSTGRSTGNHLHFEVHGAKNPF